MANRIVQRAGETKGRLHVMPAHSRASGTSRVAGYRNLPPWVKPVATGTTVVHGAFGPAFTYQSAICAPVQNSTSFFFLIFSKILRKYLTRCGAPMM